MSKFHKRVYNITKRIPRGRVVTYAVIARMLGNPRAARAVGNALNKNPYRDVPCHRVVKSDGSIGGFARGMKEKLRLLAREGVKIVKNKVDPEHIIN